MTDREAIAYFQIKQDNNSEIPARTEAVTRAITALREKLERQQNDPLTIEELREMDGEPVWAGNDKEPDNFAWFLVSLCGYGRNPVTLLNEKNNLMYPFMKSVEHLDGWTAYRHKPEEGETN